MFRRSLLLIIAILFLGATAHAQKAEAYRFATIGSIRSIKTCDSVLALLTKLKQNHGLQGYIFLYGRPAAIRTARQSVDRCIPFRDGYDPSRIVLVEAPPKHHVSIVMWIIPPGAEKPVP